VRRRRGSDQIVGARSRHKTIPSNRAALNGLTDPIVIETETISNP